MASVLAASPPGVDPETVARRFAPVDLKVDLQRLAPSERHALRELVQAARELDTLFLEQVWAGNLPLLLQLAQDVTPAGRIRLHAFLLNKGPWSRLDENAPFLGGVPPKPPGANFYPPDATKAEITAWLEKLPLADRARAGGFFTVLRRTPDRSLSAVPYSVAYQGSLARVAQHLRLAATATAEPSLRRFLELRGEALLSDNYHASDVAWMELQGPLEPTLGPYEVYEDEWFNAKAAFEAFITVQDADETQKLTKLGAHLQEIEDALPLESNQRGRKVPPLAPIRVVNSLFSAGDANRGVQTAAYNLPNDERVVQERGSKRVMLRNVQQAKFEKVLLPLGRSVLRDTDARRLAFDAFFTHILMHELVHGLGPHQLSIAGKATTVREQLQETYSPIEEAKADIGGLFALDLLVRSGVLDRKLSEGLYVTFVASLVRSLRFGLTEAHARGSALQLNWLLDAGAARVSRDGRLEVVEQRMADATVGLTRELLRLEGRGDRAGAQALLERLARVRPEVHGLLARSAAVPVDIEPHFVTAEALLANEHPEARDQ